MERVTGNGPRKSAADRIRWNRHLANCRGQTGGTLGVPRVPQIRSTETPIPKSSAGLAVADGATRRRATAAGVPRWVFSAVPSPPLRLSRKSPGSGSVLHRLAGKELGLVLRSANVMEGTSCHQMHA